MNDPETDRRQAIGLFRYGLIAELVHLPPGSKGLAKQLAERAARDYSIPGSTRTRVAAETLRDWLKAYRRGGFDALLPKARADRGQSRALPAAVVEALLAAKEANPKLSVQLVIRAARQSPEVPADLPLPPSTVHRLLARHGLMDKPKEEPGDHDRRRFAFAQAGELWMSDVMHGPSVLVGERTKRKTYLIAFIDDATRVIPHAAFALSENTATFLPVLRQAIDKRGLPQRLYVDNGANYRSQHLALVCAKLSIALIHARPYHPQGKGKIERFFKTLRAQLLTRLSGEDSASLTALNRRLGAWIEGEYHHTPHRGLDGATPLEQWAQTGAGGALPRAHRGSGGAVPVRGQTQGAEGPHGEPQRGGLRGRRRPGGGDGDAALRPQCAAPAPAAGRSPGAGLWAGPGGGALRQLLCETRAPVAHLGRRRTRTPAAGLGPAPARAPQGQR